MVSKAINEGLLARIQAYVATDMNSKLSPDMDDSHKVDPKQVHVVQFSRILNNWQALCAVEEELNSYYALTHDGDSNTTLIRVFGLRSVHEAIV